MRHADTFSSCHPLVNFLYFALVLGCTMFLTHPAYICISLASAFAYQIVLKGGRAVRSGLRYLLPMALLAAVVNPAFNHEGATILLYLPTGNPLTAESIWYGAASAAMLVSVVLWFSSCTEVLTTDKFVYLFGRVIPAMSLVLSMTLRFVPRFKAQFRRVSQSRRCLGRGGDEEGSLRRVREAVTVLSIMVTWSLENAIETADSMRSRGYGLPGRTAFSIYTLDERDRYALTWLVSVGGFVIAGAAAGGASWLYFPVLGGVEPSAMAVLLGAAYLALCLTPLAMDVYGDRQWNERTEGNAHAG